MSLLFSPYGSLAFSHQATPLILTIPYWPHRRLHRRPQRLCKILPCPFSCGPGNSIAATVRSCSHMLFLTVRCYFLTSVQSPLRSVWCSLACNFADSYLPRLSHPLRYLQWYSSLARLQGCCLWGCRQPLLSFLCTCPVLMAVKLKTGLERTLIWSSRILLLHKCPNIG